MRVRDGLLVAVVCVAASCTEPGAGDVVVSVSGQAFVRSGWPATVGDDLVEFDDGWAVAFEHVAVSVEAFRLSEGGDERVADEPRGFLVDLRRGDETLWTLTDVQAQRWSDVGYRFVKPGKGFEVAGELDGGVETAMREGGYSLWIEGDAEKEGRRVHFTFGIPTEVTTVRCLNGRDTTDGLIVGEGRVSEVEITLHMDHLFWDDHDAEEPRLLFGPLAYAAGDDDVVTLEELAEQRLTDLKDDDGSPLVDGDGNPIVYVPRVELPDNDLREYMIDTAMTLGHFNGEGHCSYDVHY